MCTSDDNQDYTGFDIDETKDDNVMGPVVSSTLGSSFSGQDGRSAVGGLGEIKCTEEDWGMLNKSDLKDTINSALKKFGNLKKAMSTFILDDLLGDNWMQKWLPWQSHTPPRHWWRDYL